MTSKAGRLYKRNMEKNDAAIDEDYAVSDGVDRSEHDENEIRRKNAEEDRRTIQEDAERTSKRESKQSARDRTELYYLLAEHHSKFSIDDRIKASMLYATEGNLAAVGRMMEINYDTVKDWKCQPWWPLAVRECRDKKQDELDSQLSKVVFEAINEISDRVRLGDFIAKKDGTVGRLPMKGRDLAITLGVLYDKRALIRGQATSHTVSHSHEDTVTKLEEKFKDFAMQLRGKTIEGEHRVTRNMDKSEEDEQLLHSTQSFWNC